MPTSKKPKAKAKTSKKPKTLGKVIHYYDHLGVAILRLSSPLEVGATVTFKRGDHEFTQTIDSMQVDHESIAKAKKGQEIGVKVSEPVKEGAVVVPAEEFCSCCA